MLKDIFEESFQHQYYIELACNEVEPQIREEVRKEIRAQALEEGRKKGREEERLAWLQAQRKLLPGIVQSRFPELTRLAKTQTRQIKDVTVMNEVLVKVCIAQTSEETINALISWLPDDDPEE
jgi:hypothetical protein